MFNDIFKKTIYCVLVFVLILPTLLACATQKLSRSKRVLLRQRSELNVSPRTLEDGGLTHSISTPALHIPMSFEKQVQMGMPFMVVEGMHQGVVFQIKGSCQSMFGFETLAELCQCNPEAFRIPHMYQYLGACLKPEYQTDQGHNGILDAIWGGPCGVDLKLEECIQDRYKGPFYYGFFGGMGEEGLLYCVHSSWIKAMSIKKGRFKGSVC